jgi:hypothetical protein
LVAEMRAVRVRAGRGRSKQSCNQQLQPRAHIDWLDKREHAAVVGYLGRLGQSASVPDRQTASAPGPVATHPRPHAHGSRRARSRACRRRGSGACTSCPPRPRVGSGRAAPPRPNGFLTVNPNAFLTVAPNGLFGFGVERARAAAGSRPGLWVGMELLDHSDGLVQAELDGVRYFELETGGEAGLLSVYVRGGGAVCAACRGWRVRAREVPPPPPPQPAKQQSEPGRGDGRATLAVGRARRVCAAAAAAARA